jgi:site-specific recombinase XerC
MAVEPPHVPETPVAVLSETQIEQLLRACHGPRFEDRRDEAVVRLFLDASMRRAEMASIRLEDLDLDEQTVVVVGKGGRPRACPFGRHSKPNEFVRQSESPHVVASWHQHLLVN